MANVEEGFSGTAGDVSRVNCDFRHEVGIQGVGYDYVALENTPSLGGDCGVAGICQIRSTRRRSVAVRASDGVWIGRVGPDELTAKFAEAKCCSGRTAGADP